MSLCEASQPLFVAILTDVVALPAFLQALLEPLFGMKKKMKNPCSSQEDLVL